MANINKGRVFLKLAAKALLMALKKIPVAGAVVEFGIECWKVLRDEQEQCAVEERIAQLEQAAACTPAEAQQVVAEVVQEAAARGEVFAADRVEAVRDLMAVMPAQIQNRTRATLSHAKRLGTAPAVALPVTNRFADPEREAFYTGLFPQRYPQFRAGDELPGADDWHLERLIGAGGFGEVWLARNGALAWAVKFCQDEVSAKLLLLEKKNLTLLMEKLPAGTANVVALLSTRFKTMPYWLAFEYIDGGTLESRMRLGPMSWPEAWAIFKSLLEGMAHVHKLGIVHRDLKPANILLDAQQRPRIADFGIGKILATRDAATQRTSRSFTVNGSGTFGYMSPEQAGGIAGAHAADDVYALAIILWQMLAGQLQPLESQDDIDDLNAPDVIKAVIQECRFRRRDKRPNDAGVLLARLASMQKPVVQPPQQVQRQPVVQQQVQTLSPPKLVLPTVESIHGWSADKVQALQKRTAEFLQSPVEFQHNLKSGGKGPVMVVIPAGKFIMGSPPDEPERRDNEAQHEVTLAKPFAMGKFAVTFEDYDRFCEATKNISKKSGFWATVTGSNTEIEYKYAKPSDEGWGRGRRPVINVSWDDAVAYCEWLSEQTGKTYRLPTEAEWEYACRAGTVTSFAWGSTITPKQANYDGNYAYNGGAKGEYRQKTVPVEEFAANAFGLYQMHGNVWEWTSSEYDAAYSGKETTCANKGNSDARAVRGGSWYLRPFRVRAAGHNGVTPSNRVSGVGFRLVQD